MKRIAHLVAALGLIAGLASCVAVGGTVNQSKPTKGQQLMDLKTALDRGALTQQEYEAQRAAILASPN